MEMTPIVNGLGEEFEGQVVVVQLDAGQKDNAELQSQLDLRGHPTFVVLDGQDLVVQRFIGPQTEAALRQAIASVAGS
jgi:thioredoxin-like negative regulator of GroEL